MSNMRLDKFLSEMGFGTRTEVKQFIKKKFVSVNGEIARKPEMKINPQEDQVLFQDEVVAYKKFEYIMLNKPSGVVSATEDKRDKTVIDLVEDAVRKDLFPVGRLDKDTEGLLLLTNDGILAHQLLSPKKHVNKIYFAKVQGEVTEEDVQLFAKGFQVEDEFFAMPSKLTVLEKNMVSQVELTIVEGKFHQVKRMFAAIGKEVLYLKRIQMGKLCLDDTLALGEYRELTQEELDLLKDK
ncbi:pseudouridine synthase [Anaeromicropila populeti]|uniref:Pseudouridine synthase n=1 Tax=Anaeromicropila populeti TaxID=37658 RepID=A0A1I6KYM2_9FIRM|nr:pseudouridine synthase [Anaeromicropila populeti]SFR96098.1 ribosomal small subunit pseudouridine synthase A [Anaeromicropila populeti]